MLGVVRPSDQAFIISVARAIHHVDRRQLRTFFQPHRLISQLFFDLPAQFQTMLALTGDNLVADCKS